MMLLACHHRVFALRPQLENKAEKAERETTRGLPECRRGPTLAAVDRYFDGTDAISPVPGDAADIDGRARVYPCSVFMASDQRVHHHFRDRYFCRCVLLPERNVVVVL